MFIDAFNGPKKDHLACPLMGLASRGIQPCALPRVASQAAICLAASNTSRISRIQSLSLTSGAMTPFPFVLCERPKPFVNFYNQKCINVLGFYLFSAVRRFVLQFLHSLHKLLPSLLCCRISSLHGHKSSRNLQSYSQQARLVSPSLLILALGPTTQSESESLVVLLTSSPPYQE